MSRLITRRKLLTGIGVAAPAVILGYKWIEEGPSFGDKLLKSGQWLSYKAQRAIGAQSLAREYDPADISPSFRTNGNTRPRSPIYAGYQSENFARWKLKFSGLVNSPKSFSMTDLRTRPARTQITRHDCVEGWSAIAKWKGVPLAGLLDEVQLKPDARFIVFHCADDFNGIPYYESVDLVDAFHPQTILAYEMNDADLSVGHGAPLRLRVERQLGYKQAKYVMGIEAVSSLDGIGRGNGGHWEDAAGYDWYAGI